MIDTKSLLLNIIDIGARGGISNEWKVIGEFVNAIGFEPDVQECNKLNSNRSGIVRKSSFYNYAISGTNGYRDFHITKSATCSSLYKPYTEKWKMYGETGTFRNMRAEIIDTKRVKTITLDTFCESNNFSPDFVKLDTQGSELEILKEGFHNYIDTILGLEIEVEFVPLYENQPLFSEVELFLRGKGFELFGLKRNMWKMNDGNKCTTLPGGRLIFADALFFKKELFEKSCSIGVNQVIKTVLLLIRFGLNDVVDYLLNIHNINTKLLEEIKSELNSIVSEGAPNKDKGIIIDYDEKYGF